jgi:hypothetical protein
MAAPAAVAPKEYTVDSFQQFKPGLLNDLKKEVRVWLDFIISQPNHANPKTAFHRSNLSFNNDLYLFFEEEFSINRYAIYDSTKKVEVIASCRFRADLIEIKYLAIDPRIILNDLPLNGAIALINHLKEHRLPIQTVVPEDLCYHELFEKNAFVGTNIACFLFDKAVSYKWKPAP